MDTNSLKKIALIIFCVCTACLNCIYAQYATNVIITDLQNTIIKNKMQENASKLITELNIAFFEKRKPKLDATSMSKEAISSVLSLWEMSFFRCYEADVIEKGIRRHNGYEVRNIPLFFQEAAEGENYEEGVIVFNANGIIENMYISIGTNRINELLRSANDVTDLRRRQIVLDFVENFRTSYNRKDISFIEKVFSDDALIITGRVIETRKQTTDFMGNNFEGEIIEYTRQTKTEYISRLRRVFNANNYINIKFEEVEVSQHGKYPEIYGVTIKQFWNTTRYSDIGFVFLMIDFQDEDNPIIHVRTWQPEKVGSRSISKDEVFSLGSFGNYNR